MLTLSKSRGADYAQPLALPHPIFFRDYAPDPHVQKLLKIKLNVLDQKITFI